MPVLFILLVFSHPCVHFPTKSLHTYKSGGPITIETMRKKEKEIKKSHLFLSKEVLLVNLEYIFILIQFHFLFTLALLPLSHFSGPLKST